MQRTVASEFISTDLHLSAFLLATDHPFLRLPGSPGQRGFVFAGVSEVDVAAFYSGAMVDARRLLNAVRDLKALLHQKAQ